MKPLFLDEYELTASMPLRALEKLGDGGVSVYDVQKIAPGKLKFRAKSKESEKIFAILRGSCYTVNKCGSVGLKRRLQKLVKRPARSPRRCWSVCLRQLPTCLCCGWRWTEASAMLRRRRRSCGRRDCTSFPRTASKLPSAFAARLMRLSGVAFVTLEKEGCVLRVTFQESEETPVPQRETQLTAPCDGVLQELTVLRGVPLVQEGEKVSAGQKLADCGEGESFAVARAVLLCEGVYTYACEDAQGAKARAVAKAVFLSGGTPVKYEVALTGGGGKFLYTVRLQYLLRLGVNFGENE